MCLLLIANRVIAGTPLLVLANRDEFFDRATTALHRWSDASTIVAGKDDVAGGTWLALGDQQRFAALTNVRNGLANNPQARSRGALVSGFLQQAAAPADYLTQLIPERHHYNPFNLIAADASGLYCLHSPDGAIYKLPPGIHAISNGHPQDYWPKMLRGTSRLRQTLASPEMSGSEQLLAVLHHTESAALSDLPDTGIPVDIEQQLSPIFLQPATLAGRCYGTRSSALVRIRSDMAEIEEWRYTPTLEEAGYERIEL